MEPLLDLRDLLAHEIDDLYSAEEQIIEAIPKMVQNTQNRELKQALNEHLKITREQKRRLDKVRKLMKSPSASDDKKGFLERIFGGDTKCKGTEGLIKEGEKMMGEDMDPAVKDAAIIASAQKIEHYEISGYGTARAYAKELGLKEVARLLEQTMKEEKEADRLLTQLALSKVNIKAEVGSKTSSKSLAASKKGGGGGAPHGITSRKAATKSRSTSSKVASKKAASRKRS
jgi:ferritin-like metal-binding protein YciE